MTEQPSEQRSHATIRDYLATLRRRKLVILGLIIVGAAAGVALSLTSPKSYTAQAKLEALDPSQSAGYAGLQQADVNLNTETSAQLAQTATRSQVIGAVKARLRLPDTIDQIRSKLSLSEDATSNYVLLSATGSTPEAAAALANTTANAIATLSNQAIRAQFAAVALQDNNAARALLAPFAGKPSGQLSATDQARFQANNTEASQLDQLAARIAAFSKVVTVAQVEAAAPVPTSPSSPHAATSAVLGGIVGLFIALLVVWFLESLDRRLRRPDEAESILGLPIVAAVHRGDLGKNPAEAKDGLNLAPFRMLRTNIRLLASGSDEPPRSILITSAVSEEGKTTVALGLAMSAAVAGLRTVLIEADVHRPVHAKRLGLAQGPGLTDYLRGGIVPSAVVQQYAFVDPSSRRGQTNGSASNGTVSRIACITAGTPRSFPATALGSEEFANVISQVSEVYDLVVIDTAPLLAVPETLEIIAFADAIVLCARLGRTTVEQARSVRASLGRLPERPTAAVLTDLDPGVGAYYGYTYPYDYSISASSREAHTAS